MMDEQNRNTHLTQGTTGVSVFVETILKISGMTVEFPCIFHVKGCDEKR